MPRVLMIVEPESAAAMRGVSDPRLANVTVDAYGLGHFTGTALQNADIIVVELDPGEELALARFEMFIRDQAGGRPVIALVYDLTVAAMRAVLRAGAADIMSLDFTANELVRTIASLPPRNPTAAAPQNASRGKVVAFVGAIGGCGTTAIAVQAGIVWAATARVCLIDFDVQFGNAALYLDLRPELTLADAIDADSRLDVDLLQTVAQTHSSGLNVIASPPEILPLDMLTPELVDQLLTCATQAFDIVLVELPAAWLTWSMRVVERADLTLMVTSLTVPGIHQARRQSEIIAANGYSERLRVIVNRVIKPMFGSIKLDDTEAMLGRRVDYAVVNDYPTVSAAIDGGKSLAAVKSRSRVEKDIRALVVSLASLLRAEVTS